MANEKPILLDLSAIETIATGVDNHINDSCSTEEEVQQIIDDILGTPGSGGNPGGGGGTPIQFPITIDQGGTGVTTVEEVRKLITGFNDVFTSETTNGISIGTGNYAGTKNADSVMIGNNLLTNVSYAGSTVAIGNNIFNSQDRASGGVYIGTDIGTNFSGNNVGNVLIGQDITTSNMISRNIAIGLSALRNRQGSISDVVAIGYHALSAGDNTSTSRISSSVFIGNNAGYKASIGNTVAIGESAGSGALTITRSVVIGTKSSRGNSPETMTTSQSVFIGEDTGHRRNFRNCIAIGYAAMQWFDNEYATIITNSTAIGYQATVTGDNQVQLGNSSTTTYVYGTVQSRSDERDKANITDLEYDYIRFIDALKPRNFQWDMREDYIPDPEDVEKDENGNIINPVPTLDQIVHDGSHTRTRRHNGFIAQEVKQIMDDMGFDFGGYQDHSVNGGNDVLSLGYEEFIAPMVAYMQDLRKENLAMKEEIATMRDQLNQLLQQK